MRSIGYIIKHPLCLGSMFLRKFLATKLNNSTYLKLLYFCEQGKILHLSHPRDFTEKIQWLKLNDYQESYTRLVDKIKVKDYVGEIIGKEYLIPTIGIWDRFEDIDFNRLPNQFVLKSNNGSGGAVYICRDKDRLNINEARRIVESTFKSNVGISYRELPYLNIETKFFAEALIKLEDCEDLTDYKFFCFNGIPLYCQVIQNRRTNETIDFYDMKWRLQEFCGLNPLVKRSGELIPKPENFDQMIQIAEKLSYNHKFLRVDLYNINGKIYFGEMTFFPASGFGRFLPSIWNRKLGDLIKL